MLPNFLIIGAAKCGTTSVCDILAGHPDVFMSDPKEPHFFGRLSESQYRSKRAWYESLFADGAGFRSVGEGSVSSTRPNSVDLAAGRIRDLIPEARLIYMVRHPIRRMESDWRMLRSEGRVSASLSAAIREMPSLVSWAFYWKHLNVYRSLFPEEQILVVFLEDFSSMAERELARICEHLGIAAPDTWDEPERPRNAAKDYRRLSGAGRVIRSFPAYDTVKRLVPRLLRELGRAALTVPEQYEVVWDAALRREVADRYRDGTRRLLEYCGKPADYWNLDR